MSGVEWDFKHWQDARSKPDFAAIRPTINMHIRTAQVRVRGFRLGLGLALALALTLVLTL